MTAKILLFTIALAGLTNFSFANESMKAKAKEVGNDTARAAKKAGRAVKDKTCEMINGKMECAAQKAKHGIQNAADKVEDAVE